MVKEKFMLVLLSHLKLQKLCMKVVRIKEDWKCLVKNEYLVNLYKILWEQETKCMLTSVMTVLFYKALIPTVPNL